MSAGALPVTRNLEYFPDLHPAFDPASAEAESHRCLFCYDAPCAAACPTHIDVPAFIKKIASGNLRGSALTILDANILGLSCSRVCPVDVLCEGACVMHRYHREPIEIGRLQRHAMDRFYASGAKLAAAPAAAAPKSTVASSASSALAAANTLAAATASVKVACVGGGPASIACAAELRRRGYAATVFDNRPFPGGLNTYGVAEYKLRPTDSLREVEMVRSLGVEFRQTHIGEDLHLAAFEDEFDLIFLGLGLGAMARLNIPGEELLGVIDALRFIARYKVAADFQIGRRVVVIGGGNTAIDAANAARRLGAEQVHIYYRRTEREMPAFPFEFDHSRLEGVTFHWLAEPIEILGIDGHATAVRFQETRPGPLDPSGRRSVMPVPGAFFEAECDLVIPALGQSRLGQLLANTPGVEFQNGSILVDRATGRTGNPRYYAGGDCVNGGREVVDAVADGKRAALAMIQTFAERAHHG